MERSKLLRSILASATAVLLVFGTPAISNATEASLPVAESENALVSVQDPVGETGESDVGGLGAQFEDAPAAETPDEASQEERAGVSSEILAEDPSEAELSPVGAVESSAQYSMSPLNAAQVSGNEPGSTVDNGDGTSTYTFWVGETITFPNQVVAGQPIRLTASGWMTKTDHTGTGDFAVFEGDEGSIIGIKINAGTWVIRDPKPINPWNAERDYASPDVWEIAQAAGTGEWWNGAVPGSWSIDVPWPSAENGATNPPALLPGDTFVLQILSGTLYGNNVGNQELRPDVSRTKDLTITVAEPPPEPTVTRQFEDLTVAEGETGTFTFRLEGPAGWELESAELQVRSDSSDPWVTVEGSNNASAQPLPVQHTFVTPALTVADDQHQYSARYRVKDAAGAIHVVAGGDPDGWTQLEWTTLTVTPPIAPQVTSHPQHASILAGDSASFTAAASGAPAPTVQWQSSRDEVNWTDIAGATGRTYTVLSVSEEMSGLRYRAVFTNAASSVPTNAASLTVSQPVAPEITRHPQNLSATEGGRATFTAAATGVPAPTVRWQSSADGVNWVDIAGATSTSYTIEGLTLAQNGARYRAVYTNSTASQPTNTARLTVTRASERAVAVTAHPVSRSIEAGESVTFSASATGVPAPTVRWQRSKDGGTTWFDLRGATGTTYTIEAVVHPETGERAWQYRAVFTNALSPAGVATNPATLTVTERDNVRTFCGTAYGPRPQDNGSPFCFKGPEKVLVGQDIVIEGVGGYLAIDDRTGSVVNFFLNHLYSGDPNGVYSKQEFDNPATGRAITDRRTVQVVQANADGTWRAVIPWPTVSNVSPESSGTASFTQAELNARFSVGSTHSIRMLTGSLLNNPVDRQRGASLFFTIVESLEDVVEVAEPIYPHHTFTSTASGDRAVAWVPRNVESGNPIPLTGTGWFTKDGQWGSSVTVRLVDHDGSYYQRPGAEGDASIWHRIQVGEDGVLSASIALPDRIAPGEYLAVELSTADDGTPLGDVARSWTSPVLTIDGAAYVPPLEDGATCTADQRAYSYELAPGMAVPAANVGGTIRLTGKDWCNNIGGGSLIAVKINAGGYQHLPNVTARHWNANIDEATGQVIGDEGESPAVISEQNKTIWYVIEADRFGRFDVNIPLPTRTNSVPAFGEGSYTLQLLTRTISDDPAYKDENGVQLRPDPSRSVSTNEFTVVAEGASLDDVKPGKPTAPADSLHVTDDLTEAARGGVTIDQQADRWIIRVPNAAVDEWVYVNVFDGPSPRNPWGTEWFQVDATGRITVPLAGATLPVGTNKLSVQNRNGELLGWGTVTVAAPPGNAAPAGPAPSGATMPSMSGATLGGPVGQPKPDTTPDAPVASYNELDASNANGVTGTEQDGTLTVNLPGVEGGHWVFLFLYTSNGRVVPIDWVQVGSDGTISVEIGALPPGLHKLAFVNSDGELVGWVTANGAEVVDEAGDQPLAVRSDALQAAGVGPSGTGGSDLTATLVLAGLSVLVLTGAAAGAITIVRRRSTDATL